MLKAGALLPPVDREAKKAEKRLPGILVAFGSLSWSLPGHRLHMALGLPQGPLDSYKESSLLFTLAHVGFCDL